MTLKERLEEGLRNGNVYLGECISDDELTSDMFSGAENAEAEEAYAYLTELMSNGVVDNQSLIEDVLDMLEETLYDEDEAIEFIHKETGLPQDVIQQVLDSEYRYMESIGMLEDE